MKIFIKTSLIIIFTSLLFSCEPASKESKDLTDFIPENTLVVFKIEDFETLKSDLSNSSLVSKFDTKSPYTFFYETSIFNYLKPNSSSLICVSNKVNPVYTFIGRPNKNLFNTDSIPNLSAEKTTYKEQSFQKVLINEQVIYTLLKDSIFVATNSEQNIKNLLDGKTEKTATFHKIFNVKNTQDFTAFFPINEIQIGQSLLFNFGSWAALDVEILPDALTASGVVLANDSVPQLISVFKGLQPQRNEIAKITPVDALEIISFTFDDFELFQSNLQQFKGVKNINNEESLLFEAISEVSKISLSEGNAIIIKSIDPDLTFDALENFQTANESFKNVLIYDFNNPELFSNQFITFTNKTNPKFVFRLDDFFVFSENEEVSQHIINSYLGNNCLSETSYYKETLSQISDESSLLIIKLNGNYSEAISSLLKTEMGKISFKEYPLAVLQFSYDRDFAHINFVTKEASSTKKTSSLTGKVSQIASIKLENELLSDPVFFSNHRTGGKDIVIQDVKNQLHFISSNGKTLWTKKLKSPIIGKIKEVDLLRNGKKQLAFVTQHYFYILDRTGRNVSPFPIKFNDDITQPLSVFDYDNNRKYRFIVTQGKEVLMLNSKGKTVKGFKFKKTKSDIVFSPQHFRIQGKDYIVIAEKNGRLNLLSRVGKPRVSISKTFNFSSNPITIESKKIVVITKDNTKNSIGTDGKITVIKLKVSSYQFRVKEKTKVTLDDNLMRINGILVELPFGIYTAPEIYTVNRKTYISITETQENKVYIYSKTGKLLSGFPVFGTSKATLSDAFKNGKTAILVKGGLKSILLYKF